MFNPVTWFEIYVQDIKRAKQFYETVLNIQMEDLSMPSEMDDETVFQMIAFPSTETAAGSGGAIVKTHGVPSGGNSTMVYFASEDCSIEQNRVEKAGGKILKEKFSIGEFGFCSICMDTEGNAFGLHSMQ